MKRTLVIAEKKSAATDIARALKVSAGKEGCFENEQYVITWAVGHLLELKSPEDIDRKFRPWLIRDLPILPEKFEYKIVNNTKDQYRLIRTFLKNKDFGSVVNACDAGREGELIFREIMEKEKIGLPQKRLWLSSMTTDSIINGFENLYPSEKFEGLGLAAKARNESDWLIGINCTRALTKRLQSKFDRSVYSVGRVQTPTLGMLVDREIEIASHEPEPFWKIEADFKAPDHEYKATLLISQDKDHKERISSREDMEKLTKKLESFDGNFSASESKVESKQNPYPLYDLTSLQRDANNRFGLSASRTLKAAQRLYEKEKALTYPRTDSKYLPEDYADYLTEALSSLKTMESYAGFIGGILKNIKKGNKKVFDSGKVSDHFAIIPTGEIPVNLSGDDQKIYDLVIRRVIAVFYPPAVSEIIERRTSAEDFEFLTKGKFIKDPGWLSVYGKERGASELKALDESLQAEISLISLRNTEHVTRPPSRIGEARLLSLMENAGKFVEDEELLESFGGRGLGTPATRADIIENLLSKGYVIRTGKSLKATSKAMKLVDVLKRAGVKRLTEVDLTATLEEELAGLEEGSETKTEYDRNVVDYVQDTISQLKKFQYEELYEKDPSVAKCPSCGHDVRENLFGYKCISCDFRLNKEMYGVYLLSSSVQKFIERSGIEDVSLVFRDGKSFQGCLKLDDNYRVKPFRKTDEGDYEPIDSGSPKDLQNNEKLLIEKELHSDYLEQTGKYKKTESAYYFETESFPDILGKSPRNLEPGPFVSRLPSEVCKRAISETEADRFFVSGKTDFLENFVSKKGKPFRARLFIKSNGKHGFEFETKSSDEEI